MKSVRLVSLCPSITEALFELGVGASVVGATKFCVEPEAELADLPRVGGTKDPSIDSIVALDPDVVFMNEEENRREDYEMLERRGIRVHVSFPKGPEDVPGMLRSFGREVGASPRADELAGHVENALSYVSHRRRARREDGGVPFLVLVWRKPWIVAGPDTFPSRLLEAAGGRNVIPVDRRTRYPKLTDAELAALSVKRIFLPSEPFPFAQRHVDELVKGLQIDPSAFLLCDGRSVTWHGTRTAAALRSAAQWFATPTAQS